MNKFELEKNKKYRQSNNLIESPYSQEFSVHEIKIFEIAVAACTKDDMAYVERKNDKEFIFSNAQLAKLLNTKPNVISMEIEKTAARIMKKTLHLKKVLADDQIEFQMINIIPYAEYKNGQFSFRLNYSIIPYLLEIHKNFTEFQLNNLLSMSSSYSIKLYKLLYQYKTIGRRVFLLEDIKNQFGVKYKYEVYANFKNKVIEPSIKQINLTTDLEVSYNEIKLGRKVAKIEFLFKVKAKKLLDEDSEENEYDTRINSLIGDLVIEDSTREIIKVFYKTKGSIYTETSIIYAKENSTANINAYLIDTLTKNWAAKEIKKQERLDKIEQKKSIKSQQEKEKTLVNQQSEIINKSQIENDWYKLINNEQEIYLAYAQHLLKKHESKVKPFKSLDEYLHLCIFANSNGKYYDRKVEAGLKMLDINLNIIANNIDQ